MPHFLNTDEKNEEIERLVADFLEDADRLCTALERSVMQNILSEEVRRIFQAEQDQVAKIAECIWNSLVLLDQRIPVRRSLFRDKEDSIRMYRAIVPFLSALDEQIRGLRASILSLSVLRERVLRASMELMRLEWYCRELLKRVEAKAHRVRLEQFLEQIARNTSEQDALHKEIERCSMAWQLFDTRVILPFLENMRRRSDAEHDGEACDCTGVVTLLGELKRETGKLL